MHVNKCSFTLRKYWIMWTSHIVQLRLGWRLSRSTGTIHLSPSKLLSSGDTSGESTPQPGSCFEVLSSWSAVYSRLHPGLLYISAVWWSTQNSLPAAFTHQKFKKGTTVPCYHAACTVILYWVPKPQHKCIRSEFVLSNAKGLHVVWIM